MRALRRSWLDKASAKRIMQMAMGSFLQLENKCLPKTLLAQESAHPGCSQVAHFLEKRLMKFIFYNVNES